MYLFSVMHIFLFSHFAFRILLCAMCCACVRVVWSYVVFACCLIVRCDFLYMFSVFCYIFVLAFSIFYFCFLLFVSVFGFCFFCIQVCACALLDRALWFSLYVFSFLLFFFFVYALCVVHACVLLDRALCLRVAWSCVVIFFICFLFSAIFLSLHSAFFISVFYSLFLFLDSAFFAFRCVRARCLIVHCDFLYMFFVFCYYFFVLALSILYFCFLLFVSVFGFCFFAFSILHFCFYVVRGPCASLLRVLCLRVPGCCECVVFSSSYFMFFCFLLFVFCSCI